MSSDGAPETGDSSGLRLHEVIPDNGDTVRMGSADSEQWIAERYRPESDTFTRLNMVTNLTGAGAGADGTSDTLTSTVDRTILRTIRAQADVVVVGAQTVRTEGYILPKTARMAVLTSSGDLAGHRFGTRPGHRLLVLCPEHAEDAVRERLGELGAEVVALPGERPSPASIVAALRARGLRRIVCEGGPGVASAFVSAGVLDELCVTVAPGIAAESRPFLRLSPSQVPRTDVTRMLVGADGFSYLRLSVQR